MNPENIRIISEGTASQLLPLNYELLPGVTEVYELELVYLESRTQGENVRGGLLY